MHPNELTPCLQVGELAAVGLRRPLDSLACPTADRGLHDDDGPQFRAYRLFLLNSFFRPPKHPKGREQPGGGLAALRFRV